MLKFLDSFVKVGKRKYFQPLKIKIRKNDLKKLHKFNLSSHKRHSVRAKVLLLANDGVCPYDITNSTGAALSSIYRYIREYHKNGLEFIVTTVTPEKIAAMWEERSIRVIDILHTPPKAYNINRTSWIYDAIIKVYEEKYGEPLPKSSLKRIIKETKYTWRHARQVLTSPDPEYKKKVDKVLTTLRNTKENEAFFFVDEMGPYRVKKYGGKSLVKRDSTPLVPGKQKTKGKIQAIAALEAFSNQMTWKFIETKDAAMVVLLFEMLRTKYKNKKRLFITWDAISTHKADLIKEWVKKNNKDVKTSCAGPSFKIVPLPSKSQFLNVIESVYGGMKKAVIKNSDYPSKQEMEKAVNRHFEERNEFYKKNPKRAGHKIWDKELFDKSKLHGGLFKKM